MSEELETMDHVDTALGRVAKGTVLIRGDDVIEVVGVARVNGVVVIMSDAMKSTVAAILTVGDAEREWAISGPETVLA